jgi:hypothetical protein
MNRRIAIKTLKNAMGERGANPGEFKRSLACLGLSLAGLSEGRLFGLPRRRQGLQWLTGALRGTICKATACECSVCDGVHAHGSAP